MAPPHSLDHPRIMQVFRLLLLSSALVLSSCSGENTAGDASASTTSDATAPAPAGPSQPKPPAQPQGPPPTIVPELPDDMDPVLAMYATIDALFARPEHDAKQVVVQHCLIGLGRDYPGRAPADAEKIVAQLLQDLAGGARFEDIVKNSSNDTFPGIYVMLSSGQRDQAKRIYLREDMAQAFGDAAWRLKVGEVGVTPYDPPATVAQGTGTSPFGMHVIKRLR